MAEPIATPICTTALIVSGAACTVFGLDFESAFWAFGGGLVAQTFIPAKDAKGDPVSAKRAFLMLTAGAVIGAAFTPILVNILTGMGLAAGVGQTAMKIAAAVALGIVAPVIPTLLRKKSENA